jgi:hypothetical protein
MSETFLGSQKAAAGTMPARGEEAAASLATGDV